MKIVRVLTEAEQSLLKQAVDEYYAHQITVAINLGIPALSTVTAKCDAMNRLLRENLLAIVEES